MKRLLLILILFCLCIVPVMGQDATAEPTNQVVTVIDGEGEGTTVIVEAPETPVETPAEVSVFNLGNLLSFIMGSILTGIVALAGFIGWMGTQARDALRDPSKMVLAEKVGDSVPKEHADKLLDGLTDILSFLREALDRQPALLKPSPSSTVSSTGADFSSTAPRMP